MKLTKEQLLSFLPIATEYLGDYWEAEFVDEEDEDNHFSPPCDYILLQFEGDYIAMCYEGEMYFEHQNLDDIATYFCVLGVGWQDRALGIIEEMIK